MLGFLYSILSGACMSIQGVFNTRMGEKIGLWESNVVVQSTGFALALIIFFIFGKGNIKAIAQVNKLYLFGGVLGVAIIYSVMMGMRLLGTTCAVSAILISQLLVAALIDAFGLFDTEAIRFGTNKLIGIVVMILGILIFKWK